MSTRRWVDLILAGTARIRDITRVAAPAGSTPGHVVRVAADGESLEVGAATGGVTQEQLDAVEQASIDAGAALDGRVDALEAPLDPSPAGTYENATVAVDARGRVVAAESGAAGGGAVAVEDEGSPVVASATRLNFTGAGVSVADAGSGEAIITIPGGGGGGGGSGWWSDLFPRVAPPGAAGWTLVGQMPGDTLTDVAGGIVLTGTGGLASPSASYVLAVRALGAPPYTVRALIQHLFAHYGGDNAGIALRESATGRFIVLRMRAEIGVVGVVVRASRINNPTSFNSDISTASGSQWSVLPSVPVYLEIADTGVTRTFSLVSAGARRVLVSEPSGTFCTPDQAGIFTSNLANGNAKAFLLSWEVV